MARRTALVAITFCALFLSQQALPVAAWLAKNEADQAVTFLAWPVGPATFKAVVQPGEDAACPQDEPSCTVKEEGDFSNNPLDKCGDVILLVARRELDTDAITSKFIAEGVIDFIRKALTVARIIALIPGVGTAVGLGISLANAGFTIADIVNETDIDLEEGDTFMHGKNGGVFWFRGDDNNQASVPEGGCD